MTLIKNYYGYKDELGLFQTYEKLTDSNLGHQKHDAFEDAYVTKEIYEIFKTKINEDVL